MPQNEWLLHMMKATPCKTHHISHVCCLFLPQTKDCQHKNLIEIINLYKQLLGFEPMSHGHTPTLFLEGEEVS